MKPAQRALLLMIVLGVMTPLVGDAQAPTKSARIGWMSRGAPSARRSACAFARPIAPWVFSSPARWELFASLARAGVPARSIEILDHVALITPVNIHLNAFMYEPIVDMSDDHLRALYKEVLAL